MPTPEVNDGVDGRGGEDPATQVALGPRASRTGWPTLDVESCRSRGERQAGPKNEVDRFGERPSLRRVDLEMRRGELVSGDAVPEGRSSTDVRGAGRLRLCLESTLRPTADVIHLGGCACGEDLHHRAPQPAQILDPQRRHGDRDPSGSQRVHGVPDVSSRAEPVDAVDHHHLEVVSLGSGHERREPRPSGRQGESRDSEVDEGSKVAPGTVLREGTDSVLLANEAEAICLSSLTDSLVPDCARACRHVGRRLHGAPLLLLNGRPPAHVLVGRVAVAPDTLGEPQKCCATARSGRPHPR